MLLTRILSLLLIVAVAGLSSCITSKPLETDVHVTLNENVPITITKDEGATFITFQTEDEYRQIFLSELKRLLLLQKIVVGADTPQFSITISQFTMQEITTTDTVKDATSKDNGKVFDIAVAKLRATGELVNLADQKKESWTATKDHRERVTSLQSLGQMVKQENKDLNEYRKKDFDRNQFLQLAGQCGQQAAEAIAKGVKRQMN